MNKKIIAFCLILSNAPILCVSTSTSSKQAVSTSTSAKQRIGFTHRVTNNTGNTVRVTAVRNGASDVSIEVYPQEVNKELYVEQWPTQKFKVLVINGPQVGQILERGILSADQSRQYYLTTKVDDANKLTLTLIK